MKKTNLSRFGATIGPILALALLYACDEGSSPTETDDSTDGTTTVLETYTGSFGQSETSSHQIGIGASGTAEVSLLDLEPLSTLTVGVGIGTPDDAGGCTLASQDTSMRESESISAAVTSGVFCVPGASRTRGRAAPWPRPPPRARCRALTYCLSSAPC